MFQTTNQIIYSLISGTAPPSTHLVTLSFDSLRTSFVAPVPKLHHASSIPCRRSKPSSLTTTLAQSLSLRVKTLLAFGLYNHFGGFLK